MQRVDRLSALQPDRIRNGEHGDRPAVAKQVNGRLGALRSRGGRLLETRRHLGILGLEQRGATEPILDTLDRCGNTLSGKRSEALDGKGGAATVEGVEYRHGGA